MFPFLVVGLDQRYNLYEMLHEKGVRASFTSNHTVSPPETPPSRATEQIPVPDKNSVVAVLEGIFREKRSAIPETPGCRVPGPRPG